MILTWFTQSLLVTFTLLPSFVSARGAVGHGHVGGGSIGGSSNLAFEPFDAAIYAFDVIFAIVTALQILHACANLFRRITKSPPSIVSPEFNTGPIFPVTLLLLTIFAMLFFALQAANWAGEQNLNNSEGADLSDAFFGALDVSDVLVDIFIVATALAIISHRETVLVNTSRVVLVIKRTFDVAMFLTLAALAIAFLAFASGTEGPPDLTFPLDESALLMREWRIEQRQSLLIGVTCFDLVTAVYIALSALVLYIRSRGSPVNDHNIMLYMTFIVSPLFIVFTIYRVVVLVEDDPFFGDNDQWNLAGVILRCITRAGIIQACLKMGMPKILKGKGAKEQQNQVEP